MGANKRYKDSVFTLLFGEPDKMLELYNALSGTNLPPDTPVVDATLEDALFMDRCNDLAFVIGDKIVVCLEHQSTINENLPLRLLIYIARVYERIIENKAIYRTRLIKIPKPEFYVLYNGTEDFPDKKTLRLSDAFKDDVRRGGLLDLEVTIYNVGAGRNREIVARSESLNGYAVFTERVRQYHAAGLSLEEAIKKAVDDCVADGILVDFLNNRSSEVRNMLFTEFKLDDAIEVWREEWFEEGVEKGIYKVAKNMIALNMPPEQVAAATGLPLNEVVKLSKKEEH
ncbi:MAG: Rpn family recombination-promoting nuclease/putative transposase [Oscillospiraceae bacterium]|jgi:hypothetical protein|nr:Rpn family recombination-promoting nuclease/putative transposase [Oscillospiraceae bacterium]